MFIFPRANLLLAAPELPSLPVVEEYEPEVLLLTVNGFLLREEAASGLWRRAEETGLLTAPSLALGEVLMVKLGFGPRRPLSPPR